MKKILISLAVMAAAAAAIVAVNAENRLDDQFEANLEALAGLESSQTTWRCGGLSSASCYMRCGVCGTVIQGSGRPKGRHSCSY